jgi:hypothetical protein
MIVLNFVVGEVQNFILKAVWLFLLVNEITAAAFTGEKLWRN